MRPCAWSVARTAWRSSDRFVLTLKPVKPSNIHVASSRSTWRTKWVVRPTVVAVREGGALGGVDGAGGVGGAGGGASYRG